MNDDLDGDLPMIAEAEGGNGSLPIVPIKRYTKLNIRSDEHFSTIMEREGLLRKQMEG